MSRRRFLLSAIAATYFGALIGFTFVPIPAFVRESWLLPLFAFFVVGMLLGLLMGARRWWAALAFAVLGAAWIEAAQSIWMPVGYAQLSDVIWGTCGAAVGVIAGSLLAIPALGFMHSHESPSILTQAGHREIP